MTQDTTLPPLPHPAANILIGDDWHDVFTADQLRAYALAALAAADSIPDSGEAVAKPNFISRWTDVIREMPSTYEHPAAPRPTTPAASGVAAEAREQFESAMRADGYDDLDFTIAEGSDRYFYHETGLAFAAWNAALATTQPEPSSTTSAAGEWKTPPLAWRVMLKAVLELLWAVDEKHDTQKPPLKFGVPYAAVNALRAAVGMTGAASDLCEDEGCPHHGVMHVCTSAAGEDAQAVGEIVGTERRGFALMTIVQWEPGFDRTKIGTKLYNRPTQEGGQAMPSDPSAAEPKGWRDALEFYAQRSHFAIADDQAWDTVSGEPSNFWCDEAGTAAVEDGTVAKMALAGTPLPDEEADPSAIPAEVSREPLTLSGTELRQLQMLHVGESARMLGAADSWAGDSNPDIRSRQLARADEHRKRADEFREAAEAAERAQDVTGDTSHG